MKSSNSNHLQVIELEFSIQDKVKEIILEGLAERFGFLDRTLNGDLDNIQESYINKGYTFLVGIINSEPICTGALIYEHEGIGRIVRMSVKKAFRRNGYAKLLISELEKRAKSQNFRKLVLETNKEWHDAIHFYKSNGYEEYSIDHRRVHMEKIIQV